MANEISNDVTILSVDNMIYQAIFEIRYSFSRRPDEYRILNFIKELLQGNEIDETIFWQRLKILEKEGKSLISRQRRGVHSFYQKAISTAALISTIDLSENSLVVLLPALKIFVMSCFS